MNSENSRVYRVTKMKKLGDDFPGSAKALHQYFSSQAQRAFIVQVPMLPPTINKAYGQKGPRKYLTEEYKRYKQAVHMLIGARRFQMANARLLAVVMFFESPRWLNKNNSVRIMDGDNRVKPAFDALKEGLKIEDSLYWEHHGYKVASTQERTTYVLYDLGNQIELFS